MSEISDNILKRITQAEAYHANRIASLKKKRQYFTLNYSFYAPPQVQVFKSKSIVPATKVDKTANQIIVDIPRFEIALPQGYYEIDQTRRDKQLYALKLLWHESRMRNKIPPEQDASIHISGYGEFCFSIWWDDESYESGEWPFILRSHNPETIYPISEHEVCEIYTCKVADLEEMMELFNSGKRKKVLDYNRKGRSLDTNIDIKKYYSSDARAFYVDGHPMFVKEGYQSLYQKVCPYVYGVSGWAGSSPEGNPEDESRGVLDMILDAINDQSYMQTMVKAKVARDIVQKRKILRVANIDEGENIFDDVIVDNMNDIMPMEPTDIDRSAYDYMAMLTQQINENTFGAGIQGVRQGYSGTQEAFLTGQEMRFIRPPRVQLQNAMAKISQKFFEIISEVADGPVRYQGRPIIKPNDIVHPVWVNVSLDPIDRAKQNAEIMTLKELYAVGLLSWESFHIKAGIVDDISQEHRLVIVNEMLHDKTLLQALGAEVLQEFAIREKTDAMKAMRQQKGMPEGQGVYGMAANQAQLQDQITEASQGTVTPPPRAGSVPMEDMNAY